MANKQHTDDTFAYILNPWNNIRLEINIGLAGKERGVFLKDKIKKWGRRLIHISYEMTDSWQLQQQAQKGDCSQRTQLKFHLIDSWFCVLIIQNLFKVRKKILKKQSLCSMNEETNLAKETKFLVDLYSDSQLIISC